MLTLAVILLALLLLATPVRHFRDIPQRFRAWLAERETQPGRVSLAASADFRGRPARGRAPRPPQLADLITWTRIVEPREQYRILYVDKDGIRSDRLITLQKIGAYRGDKYYAVLNDGKFKTMRADRVLTAELLPTGLEGAATEPSIRPLPTYRTELPPWAGAEFFFRVPTIKGKGTWGVDLNAYTCTCPEKRIRAGLGYKPGELGMVCPHIARAILEHQPDLPHPWPQDLLDFLSTPTKVALVNLT